MKFRELEAGRVLTFGPARLTEDEILAFAREYDPQWFHTDPSRAKAGRWDGLIASGWHTAAIAMRLVVENVLAGSETFGSPGLEYLKWLAP
ncbi:MAG TPA: MaoC/PaaZ C-terminal domain-containing protein, partial [Casimicrobiaceae bacterium]